MKKEYIARSIISTSVVLPCGVMRIQFKEIADGKSMYMTADEDIQKALEAGEYYRSGKIKIARVVEDNAPVKKVKVVNNEIKPTEAPTKTLQLSTPAPTTQTKVYAGVKRCADAISILREEYKVTAALNTKAKILEVAQSVNVEFPSL